MVAWHLAPALKQLRAEINKKWPSRGKASDGTIGNAEHSARTSDHNPNDRGSVNAMDITASGIDTGTLIAVAKRHPSVRYIIHKSKIMNRDIGNWKARPYTGPNPHNTHVHISLYQNATAENRTRSWGLAKAKPSSGGGGGGSSNTYTKITGTQLIKLHTKGDPVKNWQERALGYTGKKADGFFGPDSVSDTKTLQKQIGLKGKDVDGKVGPKTRKAWADAGEPKLKKGGGSKAGGSSKSKVPGTKYAFPYEKGGYIGPKSGPDRSHSGLTGRETKGVLDSTWNKRFVNQLVKRGWNAKKGGAYLTRHGNDGKWGTEFEQLTRAFQKDQGLAVDGRAGYDTWTAAFENPVT